MSEKNFNYIKEAEKYRENCIAFMKDLISIPGVSAKEEGVAQRIIFEMNNLGFNDVKRDDYGNVIGRIGFGPRRIVFDSHIDTVDVGNPKAWKSDPFVAREEDGFIYGRGASDNHNGTVVQVYGAKLFSDLQFRKEDFSIFVVGSVQEEDCDGLGLKYALQHSIQDVHYVCLGESTSLDVYRGHRGRMELNVVAQGISCHGSAPERGENAVYKMAKLVTEIEELNKHLKRDSFLGKGTCAVSFIDCQTPSLCAVPDGCRIHIDRRLTWGEDKELAVQQIKDLPSFNDKDMKVEILTYEEPSYTGKVLKTQKYYPTWAIDETHPLVQAGFEAACSVQTRKPQISRWVFSTNGVSSCGELGIPTIGFAPGDEVDAHTVNDRIRIDDLVTGVAFYACLPVCLK